MSWLAGSNVLLTGGGSGLGRALVTRFRAEGARVAVLERSPEKSAQLLADDPALVVTTGDVREPDDCVRAVEEAVDAFGRLDCVVANAAIWDFSRPLRELPPKLLDAAFDEMFGVNVKGVLMIASAALEHLAAARGSLIVSLSGASFYPGGGGPNYIASKHALVGVVRQLAYELAPDVRVNGVAPGAMVTDMRGPASLGLDTSLVTDVIPRADLASHSALGREPSPEDYTGAYVLLAAADQSPTATGTIIDLSTKGVRGRTRPQAESPAGSEAR